MTGIATARILWLVARLHGHKIRTHITLRPEEHARFLACVALETARQRRPITITLSGWLADRGHDRCDEMGIPPASTFIHESPPAATAASKPRKRR